MFMYSFNLCSVGVAHGIFVGVALLVYWLVFCYVTFLYNYDSVSQACMGVARQQPRSGISKDYEPSRTCKNVWKSLSLRHKS